MVGFSWPELLAGELDVGTGIGPVYIHGSLNLENGFKGMQITNRDNNNFKRNQTHNNLMF